VKEIWDLAISPQVLPFTLLLAPIALYWLLAMLGTVDLDFLNIDLDLDTDVDVDMDLDPDLDLDAGDGAGSDAGDGHHAPGAGILHSTLRVMGATDVPIMAILSIMIVFLWTGTMLGNLWFNPGQDSFMGTVIGLSALVASFILTRIVTYPLRPFFRAFKKSGPENRPVVGRSGVVRSRELTENNGQVAIEEKGEQIFLNARLMSGSPPLVRGTEVLVYKYDKESGIYYVRSLNEK
jgi:hypothetical protein